MSYFEKQLKPYCSLPAELGLRDPALLELAGTLDLARPTVLLDYGCGRGRLLAALRAKRTTSELNNLRYLGVDVHSSALKLAEGYFHDHLASTGMEAAFISKSELDRLVFVVDEIVMVFCVHEIDPLLLDQELNHLWSMLRQSGRLHVQDSSDPVHQEIEFLAFKPDELTDLLRSLTSDIQTHVRRAGQSGIDVFRVAATKLAHSLGHITGDDYRQVLHSSLLSLCFDLHSARAAFEAGELVDPEALAALCHRIAVRSRAFHQSLAFDSQRSFADPRECYCVRCGSRNVASSVDPGNWKDPSIGAIVCSNCQYRHIVEDYHAHSPYTWFTEQLRILEFGFGDNVPEETKRDMMSWIVDTMPRSLHQIGRAVLLQVPGVSQADVDAAMRICEKNNAS